MHETVVDSCHSSAQSKEAYRPVRVAFAGGGTGGHLMPGLTVARKLSERLPNAEIIFFGTQGGLEKRVASSYGMKIHQIYTEKRSGGLRHLPGFVLKSVRSFVSAWFAVRKFDPDVIVGLGGFGSFFPAIAGRLRGIPILLMEQNVLPGRVNRTLSRWASEIDCQWEESGRYLPKRARICVTGNPTRHEIIDKKSAPDYSAFGLSPHKKTLLVMGGSQGALSVNELVVGLLPHLEQHSDTLQIIHLTGQMSHGMVKKAYEGSAASHYVCAYLEDMPAAYAVTDLAVARAGGTSIAEFTAAGIPSILIPLPSAAEDHQRLNAEALQSHGAAVCVEQKNLTADRLWGLIRDLIYDQNELARMRRNALSLGRPDATDTIAETICTLAGRRTI